MRRCDDQSRDPVRNAGPPSPDTSAAIVARLAERGIEFVRDHRVAALDAAAREAVLDDDSRLPFDLFLGIPVHRAPAVVVDSGLTEDGWSPVDPRTLATRFPGAYAVGDVMSVGTRRPGCLPRVRRAWWQTS